MGAPGESDEVILGPGSKINHGCKKYSKVFEKIIESEEIMPAVVAAVWRRQNLDKIDASRGTTPRCMRVQEEYVIAELILNAHVQLVTIYTSS